MSDNQEKLTEKDFKDPYEYGFVTEIDNEKPKDYNNLASYIRIWVLKKKDN